jgi:hypothetical protein
MRRFLVLLVAAAALVAASVPAVAQEPKTEKTVWLCRPGLKDNPCDVPLTTTELSPTNETLGVENVKPVANPKIDCFYVYPTVSDQRAQQADLSLDPEIRSIALFQAAYFSRYCKVYAPVYRQNTLQGITGGGGSTATTTGSSVPTAYESALGAWRDYLEHYNKGRGVVFIGHSQGSFVLSQLLAKEVDPKPAARKKLVSAILLGGQVTVKEGSDVGGTFQNIPACTSKNQLGCVMAFSTFGTPAPSDAVFGRTSEAGLEVLCTNPAALGGGSGPLDAVVPSEPFAPGTTISAAISAVGFGPPDGIDTPWVEYPGAYTGECSAEGGADVLQITPQNGAPTLNAVPGNWGLHLVDGNIALGNFVGIVGAEVKAYTKNGR